MKYCLENISKNFSILQRVFAKAKEFSAKILLRIYMGPPSNIEYDQIFSEQLKYPYQEILKNNKENHHFDHN